MFRALNALNTVLDSNSLIWTQDDIDELVELSDEIRSARRRRIQDIQRERASVPHLRHPLHLPHGPPRIRPRLGIPPRARMVEKRMQDLRDREWMMDRV